MIKYIQDLQKRVADLEAAGAHAPNSAVAKLDTLTAPQASFGQPQEDLRAHQAHMPLPDVRATSSFEPTFEALRHTQTGLPSSLSDPAEGPPSPGRSAANASYEGLSLKKRKLDDTT